MASISSLGIGTGVLTSELVDDLVAAERDPVKNRLDAEQELVEARITEFGALKGLVSTLSSATAALSSNLTFVSKIATSSDEDAITATANSISKASSFSVQVTALAQAHALASEEYTELTDTMGTGTLSFSFGETDADNNWLGDGSLNDAANYDFTVDAERAVGVITIDASNNTLSGVRDAVNAADIGITATIVNTGSGFKLVFQSDSTGKDNSFQIDVTSSDALKNLEFNTDTIQAETNEMLQSVAAQDAALTVNGVAVTRSSNVVSEVVSGVTMTLKEITASAKTITVGNDEEAVIKKVSDFVEAYNELKAKTNELTAYDPGTNQGGLFLGDSAVRKLTTSIANEMGSLVEGLTGNIRTLSEVGISSNKSTGLLSFSESTFKEKLLSDTEDLSALFSKDGRSTDSFVNYVSNTTATVPGTYDVTVDRLAEKASYTGSLVNSFIVGPDNNTFQIKVDDIISTVITLDEADYGSGADLAAHIQSKINSDTTLTANGRTVSVNFNGSSKLEITSSTYGRNSGVQLISTDTDSLADFGLRLVDEGAQHGSYLDSLDNDLFASPGVAVTTSNNTFSMELNGTDSAASIVLTPGTYTSGDDLATEIQTQINADANLAGATVTFEGDASQGRFNIVFGETDKFSFTTVTSGFTSLAGYTTNVNDYNIDVGRDVAGSINGVAATGFGQKLTAANGDDSEGLAISIVGGATGSRGTVSFIRGLGLSLNDLFSGFQTSTTGILDIKSGALSNQLTELTDERTALDERLDRLRTRLEASFLYNDLLSNQLNTTREFLSGQFDILNSLISGDK